jgi:hypothetical protein
MIPPLKVRFWRTQELGSGSSPGVAKLVPAMITPLLLERRVCEVFPYLLNKLPFVKHFFDIGVLLCSRDKEGEEKISILLHILRTVI